MFCGLIIIRYLFFTGLLPIPDPAQSERGQGDEHGVRVHPAAADRSQGVEGGPEAGRRLHCCQAVQDIQPECAHQQVPLQL